MSLFMNQIWIHLNKNKKFHSDSHIMLWYSLQCFGLTASEEPRLPVQTGIQLAREMSCIPAMPGHSKLNNALPEPDQPIQEMRDISFRRFYPDRRHSYFSILSLSDNAGCTRAWHETPSARKQAGSFKRPLAPWAIFVDLLRNPFMKALTHWSKVLGRMETEVELKVCRTPDFRVIVPYFLQAY